DVVLLKAAPRKQQRNKLRDLLPNPFGSRSRIHTRAFQSDNRAVTFSDPDLQFRAANLDAEKHRAPARLVGRSTWTCVPDIRELGVRLRLQSEYHLAEWGTQATRPTRVVEVAQFGQRARKSLNPGAPGKAPVLSRLTASRRRRRLDQFERKLAQLQRRDSVASA